MNIVVCVKPVPDTSIISFNEKGGYLNSDDLVYVVNPHDMVAVKEAVQIKELRQPSYITLISMAPPSNKKLLQHCLALGADEAILLWNSSFCDSDCYVTATVLAKAISSLQYDLVLCGQKAADTEQGQVGCIIAEILDIPSITRVAEIEILPNCNKLTVESKLERGKRNLVEVPLPALLAVEMDLNEPRYASLPSLMASLRQDIKEYNFEALNLSSEEVGSRGSKTKVVTLSRPKPRPKKVFTPDSSLSAQERMKLIMSGGITEKKTDLIEGNPDEVSSKFIEYISLCVKNGEIPTP
jgi:electron transfer flavoprotein alpha/beta subunit